MKNSLKYSVLLLFIIISCKKNDSISPNGDNNQQQINENQAEQLLEITERKVYSSRGFDLSTNYNLNGDDPIIDIQSNGQNPTFGSFNSSFVLKNGAKIKNITSEEYENADSKTLINLCEGASESNNSFSFTSSLSASPTYCINDGENNFLINFTSVTDAAGNLNDYAEFNYKTINGTIDDFNADETSINNIKGVWKYEIDNTFYSTFYCLELGESSYKSYLQDAFYNDTDTTYGKEISVEEGEYILKPNRLFITLTDSDRTTIEMIDFLSSDSLVINRSYYSKL